MNKLQEYFSRKFVLTAGSLLAVFLLLYIGRDVSELEIVVPAILAFYFGSNVGQDWVTKVKDKRKENAEQS